ncbi:MAG: nuclear transport factor 2 family protein [Novosphingobium sp.]
MTVDQNKQIIARAMDAMAQGDTAPFGALMHPDFVWTATGTNSWAGEFKGLETVRRELLGPLFANFTSKYVNRAINILGDDDFVVVEARAHAMTKSGKPYDQAYCFVIRMREGKMMSLIEYMDTELIADVLEARPS